MLRYRATEYSAQAKVNELASGQRCARGSFAARTLRQRDIHSFGISLKNACTPF